MKGPAGTTNKHAGSMLPQRRDLWALASPAYGTDILHKPAWPHSVTIANSINSHNKPCNKYWHAHFTNEGTVSVVITFAKSHGLYVAKPRSLVCTLWLSPQPWSQSRETQAVSSEGMKGGARALPRQHYSMCECDYQWHGVSFIWKVQSSLLRYTCACVHTTHMHVRAHTHSTQFSLMPGHLVKDPSHWETF